jgi:transposase
LLKFPVLFPHFAGLRVECLLVLDDSVHVGAHRRAATARCPTCGHRSRRVHSRYTRRITDEPLGGRPVVVHLRVRRFFCRARACPKRTFAEQAPTLAGRYARRSTPLSGSLQQIGVALGGRPGTRLSAALHRPVSRMTLLRLIRALPLPAPATPRVLGMDDWAFRKGHRYGTILVDLEQHRVVELLDDRKAETVAQWLQEHPGVEIISRDRARAYAEAARTGAPQAIQVVDRWHLLKNLVEALERCLLRHGKALKVAAGRMATDNGPLPSYAEAARVPWQQRAEAASQQRHAGKVEQYEQIHALQAAGFTKLDIADLVGVSRPTVDRYLQLKDAPERRRPQRSERRVLELYEPYLQERWAQGCRNRSRLFREIRAQGYQHGASTVFRFLPRLERDQPGLPVSLVPPTTTVPSARHVACLLVQRPDNLANQERDYLTRLGEHEPTLATAYELAQAFAVMVRERPGEHHLQVWLAQATASGIQELSGFSRGVAEDQAPVEAALSFIWSNGQTEGQVNKLKLLKRQMYGRASFEFLRRRRLLTA